MKYLTCLCLTCVMLPVHALAAPSYRIVPLGLFDPEHTRSDGYQHSYAHNLNSAGQAIGSASRYNGGNPVGVGTSAWFYDGSATKKIGLTGLEHTASDGRKSSGVEDLNEAGQVLGWSGRYNGRFLHLGSSAWLYDGATTIDIGLTDAEHTRADGYKSSRARGLDEAGRTVGTADRFNGGSSDLGDSAWFYNGATTVEIGLTGQEHTRADGYQFNWLNGQFLAGHVTGHSNRYDGSTALGTSAWFYNGATTVEIGFTGPEYTRDDGYKSSYPISSSDTGIVAGTSDRFNGGNSSLGSACWLYDGANTTEVGLNDQEHTRNDGALGPWFFIAADPAGGGYPYAFVTRDGQTAGNAGRYNGGGTELGNSAWFYNGAATTKIGLYGPEHTRADGYQQNTANYLSETGHVLGTSTRFHGGEAELGRSAWLYDGTTTIDIGLTGPEHTRSDGYRSSDSWISLSNTAEQVIGSSDRFNGGDHGLGTSAWLYNGTTTIDIGLTGPVYTREDSYRQSEPRFLNEAGQVAGSSTRYDSNSHDAWLYDPVLDQTIALRFPGTGLVYSDVEYLGDDGLVLGTYRVGGFNDPGSRWGAFYFTIVDGLHDLGSLVDGGLAAAGWSRLADAVRANGAVQILGGGFTSQGHRRAYLLTPVVPEPNSAVLVALATLTLVSRWSMQEGLMKCRRSQLRSWLGR